MQSVSETVSMPAAVIPSSPGADISGKLMYEVQI